MGAVLGRIVEAVAGQDGVALARVWLVEPGDLCEVCSLRTECPDRTRCLHLVASAGRSLDGREAWDGVDGAFRRFPLGVRKVGRVGATGTGILLHDMTDRSTWIVRPDWAAGEGIRSFAAQPLAFQGAVLGVLAAFSRQRIDAPAFACAASTRRAVEAQGRSWSSTARRRRPKGSPASYPGRAIARVVSQRPTAVRSSSTRSRRCRSTPRTRCSTRCNAPTSG